MHAWLPQSRHDEQAGASDTLPLADPLAAPPEAAPELPPPPELAPELLGEPEPVPAGGHSLPADSTPRS